MRQVPGLERRASVARAVRVDGEGSKERWREAIPCHRLWPRQVWWREAMEATVSPSWVRVGGR